MDSELIRALAVIGMGFGVASALIGMYMAWKNDHYDRDSILLKFNGTFFVCFSAVLYVYAGDMKPFRWVILGIGFAAVLISWIDYVTRRGGEAHV